MSTLWQDLRYAVRMLGKSPGFTAVAVLTLALGIGANTAIFSVINGIMLRTLPVRDPQSLVLLKWKARRIPTTTASFAYDNCMHGVGLWDGRALISQTPLENEGCSFSFPLYQAIREKSAVFSDVLAFVPASSTLNFGGRTARARVLFVSGNFFSALGAHPALGRLIAPADDSAEAIPTIVVSYRFWQNELGGDPSIVGKHALVGNSSFTVSGVVAAEFPELDPGLPSDVWVPLAAQPLVEPRFPKMTTANALWIEVIARLKPGVSSAQAASAVSAAFAASTTNGADAMFKAEDAPRIDVLTAARGLATLRQNFSRPLFALLAGVAIVLLISCANIAGLMLARSAARRKELAMRVALGATRARIIRQLLTESILLSLGGGACGILLGSQGARALTSFLSDNWFQPVQVDVHPDARVLAFTFLVSLLVGVMFGLAPAFSSKRDDLLPALKESARGAPTHGSRITLGNSLVVLQMALTMVALTGAGLLVRTLSNLKFENVGFDAHNLLLFRVDATYSQRTGDNLKTLYRDLQEQLSALPGVTSVTRSGVVLLSGGGIGGPIHSEDQPGGEIVANSLPVAGNFFQTMRIPLYEGRTLNAQDSEGAGGSTHIVVNEMLAHRLFGAQNPLGKRLGSDGAAGHGREIVGVVGDGKYANLRDDNRPTIYTSVDDWDGDVYFEIRSALNPREVMSEVRAAVTRFDSNLLITDMKTQAEEIDQNIYQERLIANLSSLFALLALAVACIGIYGLLSYQVARRTREMGVRLALGATPGNVLSLVIRRGAWLAGAGAFIGVGVALVVTRYLQSFLFGVKPYDPWTTGATVFGLMAVALFASYIPARRAMKTEPMVALRYE